ncbi:MAG: S8 family serine peptidase [Candidatus Sericytochromatia bacterium]|nr:S8 family serine peptidase [Candidatus Tanganyikabacteria bacterium]
MQYRRISQIVLLAAVTTGQLGCGPSRSAAPGSALPPIVAVPGEAGGAAAEAGPRRIASAGGNVSVTLAAGADAPAFFERLARRGLRVRAYDAALGIASVAGASAGTLAGDPAVAEAWNDAPRARLRSPRLRAANVAQIAPDPLEGAQWGLSGVRAQAAWALGATGRGARVAILDTGIDPDNPDLAPQVDFARSASFVPGEDLVDRNGHGSHVAGIVAAARNGLGVVGVAPEATLLIVKVLDQHAYGDDFGILAGIRHAADQGAHVINMSLQDRLEWGSPAAGAAARAYARAIRYAGMRGALVVAGSGNDAEAERTSGWTHLPAALPWVLGVSAIGPVGQTGFDAFAFYSNFGNTLVDVAAPGGGIGYDPLTGPYIADPADLVLSTWSTHAIPHEVQGVPLGPAPWSYFAGTSMACAFASGVAALAVAARHEPPQAVASRIMRTARAQGGRSPYLGAGIVDAYQAVFSP